MNISEQMKVDQSLKSASLAKENGETSTATSNLLDRVLPSFDVTTVRCRVETEFRQRIMEDADLMGRLKEVATASEESHSQLRIHLLTNGFRVDEAITPKLHRIGSVLMQILRLPHPLDIFVLSDNSLNACCFPSRKGSRLVMGLNSGLVACLSRQELLKVMGHEVGHALLGHLDIPTISFDDPRFSPLEVIKLRALSRAQEISCDRFGLLACQDVRVASTTLFKVASGLTERWFSFDEVAYARHFERLVDMAELTYIGNVSSSHPWVPLRVNALIAFAKSELYASAFGRHQAPLSTRELESSVEIMLSVLLPDLSKFEGAKEKEVLAQFLYDGALLVIAADGVIEPSEIAWLESFTEHKWSLQELGQKLDSEEFVAKLHQRLAENAHILTHKLSERNRAGLLHVLCEVALCASGIHDSEIETLNHFRQLLGIRVELADVAIQKAREESETNDSGKSVKLDKDDDTTSVETQLPSEPLDRIVVGAKLTERANSFCAKICDGIREQHKTPDAAIRALISSTISASNGSGPLTKVQAKKIAITAVKVLRDLKTEAGVECRSGGTPVDRLIREHGVIALFRRGEVVRRASDSQPYVITSISRTNGSLCIALKNAPEATEVVMPEEIAKDPVNGAWPPELTW